MKPPRLRRCDGVEDRRHERADEDHSKRKGRNVVLIAHTVEQFAVLDARPAAADDGIDVVALEFGNEIYRQVLVKKDAHQPGASRARGLARRQPAHA